MEVISKTVEVWIRDMNKPQLKAVYNRVALIQTTERHLTQMNPELN